MRERDLVWVTSPQDQPNQRSVTRPRAIRSPDRSHLLASRHHVTNHAHRLHRCYAHLALCYTPLALRGAVDGLGVGWAHDGAAVLARGQSPDEACGMEWQG